MDYELSHKAISPLVSKQFPAFYAEEGPLFITFVQEYYKWMETSFPAANLRKDTNGTVAITAKNNRVLGRGTSFLSYFKDGDPIAIYYQGSNYHIYHILAVLSDEEIVLKSDNLPHVTAANLQYRTVNPQKNPLYYARRLLDNHDIDICEEEFVLLFKEKYLKDIYFDTIIDVRKFIKHSLDLYRSKGTARSIDLLYRSVFGKPADIYYPGDDLFTLSSAEWFVPKYLELSLNDLNYHLQNKQITGISSGAVAFVDAIVRKTIKNKLVDVAYVSAIEGTFETGEKVTCKDLTLAQSPFMTGSLNEIRIPRGQGGQGFNVGELLDVTSMNGEGAIARVLKTANNRGTLDFLLIDGGYGYTEDSEVILSDSIITVANVVTNNAAGYLNLFSEITQAQANLHYHNANGIFFIGDMVYTYHANNQVKGTGKVLKTTPLGTSGYLTVSVISGDLDEPNIYKAGNVVVAELDVIDGYIDASVTANVIGYYPNTSVYATLIGANNFLVGETVIQDNTGSQGIVLTVTEPTIENKVSVSIVDLGGAFVTGKRIRGQSSNSSANVISSTLQIGVIDISTGGFVTSPGTYVYSTDTGFSGTLTRQSQGEGGSFTISDLQYTETININRDLILPYANVALNATAYGFTAIPTGNGSSDLLVDILDILELEIGSVGKVTPVDFGSNFDQIPIALIYDENMYTYGAGEGRDREYVYLSNASSGFEVGELVTQTSTSARGIVVESSSDVLLIKRMRYYANNQFQPTVTFDGQIVGMSSGATANVLYTEIKPFASSFGLDANVEITLSAANGVLETVQVIDSGIGYGDDDTLLLTSNSNAQASGDGILKTIGTGSGYYKSDDGFLSDVKKIFDGRYYQWFSYDVRSAVIDPAKRELKKVVHVAGTKYFDSLRYDTQIPVATKGSTEKKIT